MKKRSIWLVALTITCATALFLLVPAARAGLDPFCTYRVNASVEGTIEVGGKQYHSTAVYRASQSREWIAPMNSGGCIESHGTVLVFKLDSGAVVLVPNGMCRASEDNLRSAGQSNVVADCDGRPRPDGDAFALDSGTAPTLWKPVEWGEEVKLVSMMAKRSLAEPADQLEQNAPGTLDANFDYAGDWWASPERVIPFERRYEKDEPYRFEVQLGEFELK